MNTSDNKTLSLVERLKKQALEQKREPIITEVSKTTVIQCPDCGAARAKSDGLTHCAYCGRQLMDVVLTDGIHIKSQDNSPK
mgnify:CR=1 FL=1